MKRLFHVLGVFALVVGMLGAFMLSSQPVSAATSKPVRISIYKSTKVTTSNSTLKSYVTYAMGKIDTAAADYTLDVTVVGPYSRNWTGCYDDFDAPHVDGNPNNRYITMNYFAYQLHYNGYAHTSEGWAVADMNPTKWGKTCTDRVVVDWYNKKLVTHELGHVFDAEDRCGSGGVMDKCGCLFCTYFGSADKTLINDYLEDW